LIDDLDTHGLAVELGSPFPAYFANQEFFVAEHADKCCEVQLNQDNVAEWVPKASYKQQISTLQRFIESMPSEAKFYDGIQHPLLNISRFCISLEMSKQIGDDIYGHRKLGNKAFSQLLSYLGIRSHTDKKANLRTLTFDPEAWNRMGVRLIKGGDSKGGRPKIVYL